MATMNISLPDELKQFVERQSADGRYSNNSDFIRDLVRQEQDRQEKIARMQTIVDEARASGISKRTPQQIRDDVLARWRAEQDAKA